MPNVPMLPHRSVRRLRIELGGSSLHYERVVERATVAPQPGAAGGGRTALTTLVAGATLGGFVAIAAVLAGANGSRAAVAVAAPEVVSVELPAAAKPAARALPQAAARPRVPAAAKVAAPAVSRLVPETAPGEVASIDLPATGFSSRDEAVRAALASGSMQQWSDTAHAVRGFVVVGTGGASGGCQTVAILTRTGDASDVRRFEHCPGEATTVPDAEK